MIEIAIRHSAVRILRQPHTKGERVASG